MENIQKSIDIASKCVDMTREQPQDEMKYACPLQEESYESAYYTSDESQKALRALETDLRDLHSYVGE